MLADRVIVIEDRAAADTQANKSKHQTKRPFAFENRGEMFPSVLDSSQAAFLIAAVDCMNASRSALIKSACVVGIPCGRPG
jgi:hypothetical protein